MVKRGRYVNGGSDTFESFDAVGTQRVTFLFLSIFRKMVGQTLLCMHKKEGETPRTYNHHHAPNIYQFVYLPSLRDLT